MQLGTVTSAPALRGVSALSSSSSVTPVRRISPDWVDESSLDELTQSDRALIGHVYGADTADDSSLEEAAAKAPGAAHVDSLAREINRERRQGMVSGERDLTAEDLRRMIGRLTVTSTEPVPVQVQVQLMSMLKGTSGGRLDVVL